MKIGILGGTFNPIHNGHIKMAESVMAQAELNKICFLPNGQPPHKSDTIEKHHRLEMVKLAIEENKSFYVSDYEINQTERCYTVDTVEHFNACDENDYYFIIGADSLFQLDFWKNPEKLKRICRFIVCDRLGNGDTAAEVRRLKAQGCDISLADMSPIEIDSTSIRKAAKCGLDISAYVPKAVAEYIAANGLYKQTEVHDDDRTDGR